MSLGARGLLAVFLALAVLAAGQGDFRPTAFELLVAPHRYSLATWELSNFPDKWLRKLAELMPWTSEVSREERVRDVAEYFRLGERLVHLEERLRIAQAGPPGPGDNRNTLQAEIASIEERRRRMQAGVEETIESEISAVLSQEGFASRIGLIFPPVDTVFSKSPTVLVTSPRDRIERLATMAMKPGLSGEVRGQIEGHVLREQGLSALVVNTGGFAAYPSVVSDSHGLHHAMETAAHEWLHHWFFFQPLGQHFWDSAEMITLNETAATIGGEAIGDRAYTAVTGQPAERAHAPVFDPDGFDFTAAMRETRLGAEELLAQGKVQEAEAYMEERRRLMETHGYRIRKINQAFFAFHGSYATSAASVSPIDEQLRALQARSASTEEFIKTVAGFGSYDELVEHLHALRAEPATQ